MYASIILFTRPLLIGYEWKRINFMYFDEVSYTNAVWKKSVNYDEGLSNVTSSSVRSWMSCKVMEMECEGGGGRWWRRRVSANRARSSQLVFRKSENQSVKIVCTANGFWKSKTMG